MTRFAAHGAKEDSAMEQSEFEAWLQRDGYELRQGEERTTVRPAAA
jgi:hypothetical protein